MPPAARRTASPAAVSHSMVRAEARVEVGLAAGDHAEFQRRADRDDLGRLEIADVERRSRASGASGWRRWSAASKPVRTCDPPAAVDREPLAHCDRLGMAGTAGMHLAAGRREDHADFGHAVADERDVDREIRPPVDEFPGAVERIDQEEGAVRARTARCRPRPPPRPRRECRGRRCATLRGSASRSHGRPPSPATGRPCGRPRSPARIDVHDELAGIERQPLEDGEDRASSDAAAAVVLLFGIFALAKPGFESLYHLLGRFAERLADGFPAFPALRRANRPR